MFYRYKPTSSLGCVFPLLHTSVVTMTQFPPLLSTRDRDVGNLEITDQRRERVNWEARNKHTGKLTAFKPCNAVVCLKPPEQCSHTMCFVVNSIRIAIQIMYAYVTANFITSLSRNDIEQSSNYIYFLFCQSCDVASSCTLDLNHV